MVPIPLAFISGIGVWEIMVILVVALIVFGPRLPQVARTVGKGYMEFKRGLRTLEGQIEFGDIDVEVSNPRNGGRGESDTPPVPTPDRVGEVDPEPPPGGAAPVEKEAGADEVRSEKGEEKP